MPGVSESEMAVEGKDEAQDFCGVSPALSMSSSESQTSRSREDWLAYLQDGACVLRFLSNEIPSATLDKILETSGRTPSPWTLQPWKHIVVADPATRANLLNLCDDPGPATDAPVLLVGLGDPSAWKRAPEKLAELRRNDILGPEEEVRKLARIRQQWRTGDAARVLAIAQTYAALQQTRMVALAFEVCSWWVHDFDGGAIAKTLHIPGDHIVVGVLALGFCENKHALPNASWRRAVFGEAYGLPWNG